MNKQDLVKMLAGKCALSPRKSSEVVSTFFKIISDALYCGESVRIAGFGTFWVKFCDQTSFLSSACHHAVLFPPRFLPKFRCSKVLKRRFVVPNSPKND